MTMHCRLRIKELREIRLVKGNSEPFSGKSGNYKYHMITAMIVRIGNMYLLTYTYINCFFSRSSVNHQ